MSDTVFAKGNVAVITGGAMGIGLAAGKKFAEMGMSVCIADSDADELAHAGEIIRQSAGDKNRVLCVLTDVSDAKAITALKESVTRAFGVPDVLMNNAVTRIGRGFWEDIDTWQKAVAVNLWGVIYGVRAFAPDMMARAKPGIIINVGSKQGITNPPGHPVYNLCKAALKSYTESLEHKLRNSPSNQITSHLLIPGWTTTGKNQPQDGAWMPGQVVDFMIDAIAKGDFYILCPDNDVTPAMDKNRILWSAEDITKNRPPLSRWHGDFNEEFAAFNPDL